MRVRTPALASTRSKACPVSIRRSIERARSLGGLSARLGVPKIGRIRRRQAPPRRLFGGPRSPPVVDGEEPPRVSS